MSIIKKEKKIDHNLLERKFLKTKHTFKGHNEVLGFLTYLAKTKKSFKTLENNAIRSKLGGYYEILIDDTTYYFQTVVTIKFNYPTNVLPTRSKDLPKIQSHMAVIDCPLLEQWTLNFHYDTSEYWFKKIKSGLELCYIEDILNSVKELIHGEVKDNSIKYIKFVTSDEKLEYHINLKKFSNKIEPKYDILQNKYTKHIKTKTVLKFDGFSNRI